MSYLNNCELDLKNGSVSPPCKKSKSADSLQLFDSESDNEEQDPLQGYYGPESTESSQLSSKEKPILTQKSKKSQNLLKELILSSKSTYGREIFSYLLQIYDSEKHDISMVSDLLNSSVCSFASLEKFRPKVENVESKSIENTEQRGSDYTFLTQFKAANLDVSLRQLFLDRYLPKQSVFFEKFMIGEGRNDDTFGLDDVARITDVGKVNRSSVPDEIKSEKKIKRTEVDFAKIMSF